MNESTEQLFAWGREYRAASREIKAHGRNVIFVLVLKKARRRKIKEKADATSR